ncbi:CALMF-like protein [Mya arenaria]|uniref:CALMF-like protein n=1 Tax=Mya arenaria TaxID=6604 RepID=A0ABY7F8F1_MYAAR|nr:CALMF-like protein [Mya arenaria]
MPLGSESTQRTYDTGLPIAVFKLVTVSSFLEVKKTHTFDHGGSISQGIHEILREAQHIEQSRVIHKSATSKKEKQRHGETTMDKGFVTVCLHAHLLFIEIRELFRLFDTNNDRSISVPELSKAMRFLGILLHRKTCFISGKGMIEFQEFYTFMHAEMIKLIPKLRIIIISRLEHSSDEADFTNNQETVRSAFRTFDMDGNGYIDERELR